MTNKKGDWLMRLGEKGEGLDEKFLKTLRSLILTPTLAAIVDKVSSSSFNFSHYNLLLLNFNYDY